MAQEVKQAASADRRVRWRCFRPLCWWLGISCILLLWDLHLRNAARTTLSFSVFIENDSVSHPSQFRATVDGQPVQSGKTIPIGKRRIEISAPDTEPFSTNFFVWYGPHRLGNIHLPWMRGRLNLTISPEASLVTLSGPHARLSLTNTSGANLNLPVGQYDLNARIGPFREQRTVQIMRNGSVNEALVLQLGKVEVTSEPAAARFQLTSSQQADRDFTGETPAFLEFVPAGSYQLETWIGDYRKRQPITITKDITNQFLSVFEFGALNLTSDPEGATVQTENRRTLGETPLTLTGLQPGTWTYQLQRNGYEATNVTLTLRANETTQGQVRLLDRRYRPAMEQARQALDLEPPDLDRAIESVNLALEAMPGDPAATELKQTVRFVVPLTHAKSYAEEHLARNALSSIYAALELRPDDEEAKALRDLILAHYDEWEREEFTESALRQLETASRTIAGSEFFDVHQWTVKGDVSNVQKAITAALPTCDPEWRPQDWQSFGGSVFLVQGNHRELLKPDKHCLIVVAEIAPGEVLVVARFWDFVLGLGRIVETRDGNPVTPGTIPVHPNFYKSSQPEEAKARREAIAESFINALDRQLGL